MTTLRGFARLLALAAVLAVVIRPGIAQDSLEVHLDSIPPVDASRIDTSYAPAIESGDSEGASVRAQETSIIATTVEADTGTPVTDALSGAPRPLGSAAAPGIDSTLLDSSAAVDTTYRIWHNPFIGIGVGWTLGSMAVFDLWQKGLPKGLSDVNGAQEAIARDTLRGIVYRETETPSTYNVAFPISVAVSSRLRDGRRAALATTFTRMQKNYGAKAGSDSLGAKWERTTSLALTRVALEGTYHFAIPRRLFKIDRIENSDFVVGIGVAPFTRLSVDHTEANEFTGIDASYDRSYQGIAVSWQAGMSTLRKLADGNGLEIGVVYQGSWMGYFRRDGVSLLRGGLESGDAVSLQESTPSPDRSDPLSFVSHRFRIYFLALMGRKEPREGEGTGTGAAPREQ